MKDQWSVSEAYIGFLYVNDLQGAHTKAQKTV